MRSIGCFMVCNPDSVVDLLRLDAGGQGGQC